MTTLEGRRRRADEQDVFEDLWLRVRRSLLAAQGSDGGLGPRAGLPSEPEPTALAAIALDDAQARSWLAANQRADGSFTLVGGPVVNDSATGLASVALGPGTAAERAIDHLVGMVAARVPDDPRVPHDPDRRGWAWTEGTFGWVEPTARALLGLRLRRPDDLDAIGQAIEMLRDREVSTGGWNHGNPVAFGVDLPAYGQTTALALVAMHGLDPSMERRGIEALQRLWKLERSGSLTLATSAAALRLHGAPEWVGPARELDARFARMPEDVVTLCWAAIAVGPGLDVLREPS